MSLDRETTNFYDSLYDVHTKCYRCSQSLGKSLTDKSYVRDRIKIVQEKSINPEVKNLASFLLDICEKCDTTLPLVARRIIRS